MIYPLTNRFGGRLRSPDVEIPAPRRVPDATQGLPEESAEVGYVIEPARDGLWAMTMRSVQATYSGVPRQRTFYWATGRGTSLAATGGASLTAAGRGTSLPTTGRGASLAIQTASVRDVGRSLEHDQARLHREVRMFCAQAAQGAGLGQRRARPAGCPAAPPVIGDWSDGTIVVSGMPTPIRSAPVGEDGWIGWWVSGDHMIEVQGRAISPDQVALSYRRN